LTETGNGGVVPEPTFDELIEAMKTGAGILQENEIPFVLGGGLSAWARGGPKTEHDVDFLIRKHDAEAAFEAFERAGMKVERPPEGWLYKAWHENGALIDLIFNPSGGPITDELIENSPTIEVMALRIRVLSLEDVLATKLLAITEQEPEFGAVLELARALREQVDWETVRARTESSPFAKAFFTLVEELGIVERVRVSDQVASRPGRGR
jgi:predicted nucleotidyltransferase